MYLLVNLPKCYVNLLKNSRWANRVITQKTAPVYSLLKQLSFRQPDESIWNDINFTGSIQFEFVDSKN